MDKDQAQVSFWEEIAENLGIEAYQEGSVPGDAQLPYLTYSVANGEIGHIIPVAPSLWDRSESWMRVSKMGQSVYDQIGYGGKIVPLERGYMYVYRGDIFSERMLDPEDDKIKRIYMNLNIEFLTD